MLSWIEKHVTPSIGMGLWAKKYLCKILCRYFIMIGRLIVSCIAYINLKMPQIIKQTYLHIQATVVEDLPSPELSQGHPGKVPPASDVLCTENQVERVSVSSGLLSCYRVPFLHSLNKTV
ncbi:unnamed protein product [Owenia fusiformis]|uniref:Uncharacterized protein n=1 Tax=Owenia fusiformis TaxID=6347 RepID=A0A8S4PTQ8_OWEFU|nr:unnamed protein product [Owenia fusiformis]